MTLAAKAGVLNEICYFRIFQKGSVAEEPRWMSTLTKIAENYQFWQSEPFAIPLSADDPVSEMYNEVIAHRDQLRSLAEDHQVSWAEASAGLFD